MWSCTMTSTDIDNDHCPKCGASIADITGGMAMAAEQRERIDQAEIGRLRAFHEAWVADQVARATGHPGTVTRCRLELIAAHKAVRAHESNQQQLQGDKP